MAREYCVHAGHSRGPLYTKCGFKTKRAAQRFAQRARREGESARVQALGGARRRRRRR